MRVISSPRPKKEDEVFFVFHFKTSDGSKVEYEGYMKDAEAIKIVRNITLANHPDFTSNKSL